MDFAAVVEQLRPVTEFPAAQACTQLQIERRNGGFAIGERVAFPTSEKPDALTVTGTIRAFACHGYAPAAWVQVDAPSGVWTHVAPLGSLRHLDSKRAELPL